MLGIRAPISWNQCQSALKIKKCKLKVIRGKGNSKVNLRGGFLLKLSAFSTSAHQILAGDPVVSGLVSGWARVA